MSTSPQDAFQEEVRQNIRGLMADKDVQALSRVWMREITPYKYAYNFTWMGRPIIQFPQDMLALQEIVWKVQPDLIIETGIAHGGSLIYSASLLQLLNGNGKVLGIDIDIRPHNKEAILAHPLAHRIEMLEGSSISDEMAETVRKRAEGCKSILIILDSNHTHEHVLKELQIYAPLCTSGSYVIVYDTLVEDMPAHLQPTDRPWGLGNNPKTAVHEYLKSTERFVIDKELQAKLLLTVAPDGWLKCIQ